MAGNIIDAPISIYRNNDKVIWQLPTTEQLNQQPGKDLHVSHTLIENTPGSGEERVLGQFVGKEFVSDSPKAAMFSLSSPTMG